MAATSTQLPSALVHSITRLIEVVEEENKVLELRQVVSHAGYTDRKNHALRELLAAQRRELSSEIREALRPVLQRLSGALQANARLLKHHIAAVGEVSDIIVNSLKDADSDGTYSRESRMQRGR